MHYTDINGNLDTLSALVYKEPKWACLLVVFLSIITSSLFSLRGINTFVKKEEIDGYDVLFPNLSDQVAPKAFSK